MVGLYIRLFVMMFLQYAIWGAWAPVFGATLGGFGFTTGQIGFIFSLMPLACMLSPFLGGQIADRWMPTQVFLAICHIGTGVAFLITSTQVEYAALRNWMFVACFFYAPTLALTNSLSFRHMAKVERDFGLVRVGGTIGWIVMGWILTGWRRGWFEGTLPTAGNSDCLLLAGWAAIAMGVYCLTLPHTPPAREGANPFAFVEAFRLLKDPVFAIFIAISFVVTTELQFFYVLTPQFLEHLGISHADVPAKMTYAQIAEIFVMALALPLALPKLGIRKTLAIGVLAWPIRYIVFSIGHPLNLVVASLTLHGFCYVFFFTVSQVYVDRVAPKDIRASAQGLLALITLGFGSWLGAIFCGKVGDYFTRGGVTNWQLVFLVPVFLTIACAAAFMIFFKEPKAAPEEAVPAAA